MNTIKFTLTFTGEVAPAGDDPLNADIPLTKQELEHNLHRLMREALGNGMVTGNSPATLNTHNVAITVEETNDNTSQ